MFHYLFLFQPYVQGLVTIPWSSQILLHFQIRQLYPTESSSGAVRCTSPNSESPFRKGTLVCYHRYTSSYSEIQLKIPKVKSCKKSHAKVAINI